MADCRLFTVQPQDWTVVSGVTNQQTRDLHFAILYIAILENFQTDFPIPPLHLFLLLANQVLTCF